MFEEIIKEQVEQGQDQQVLRFCKALDHIAEGKPADPLKRVCNALWQGFTPDQRIQGQNYLVAMGYLGEATVLLTEWRGQIVRF